MSEKPTIGTALSFAPDADNAVDSVIDAARRAARSGIQTGWLGQQFDYDAIALAGLIGREVTDLKVGTSAVPIFGRHPINIAMQAQTAQAATGGRFSLGLALGAARLTESAYGVAFERPVRRLEEFLTVVHELFRSGFSDFHGSELSAVTPLSTALPGADPPPSVLVAALGPRAVAAAGCLADGILPYLAAPSVLRTHIVPALTAAAAAAGRPTPRIVALVPTLVTDDLEQAREQLAGATELFDSIPSYQRVIHLAGKTRAAELAVVGSAQEVAAGLREYLDAGATDLIVTETGLLGEDVEARTWEVAASLASQPIS